MGFIASNEMKSPKSGIFLLIIGLGDFGQNNFEWNTIKRFQFVDRWWHANWSG